MKTVSCDLAAAMLPLRAGESVISRVWSERLSRGWRGWRRVYHRRVADGSTFEHEHTARFYTTEREALSAVTRGSTACYGCC